MFNLCNLLKERENKSKEVEAFLQDEKFQLIEGVLVEKEATLEARRLAGFDKNKKSIAVLYDK